MISAVLSAVALIMPAPATGEQKAPPPLPRSVFADYFPGPWGFLFVEGGTRFTSDTDYVLGRVAEMAQILPDMGIALCATDAIGRPDLAAVKRRRLTKVAALIRRAGIKHVIFGSEKDCANEQLRAVPAVMAYPHPSSPT